MYTDLRNKLIRMYEDVFKEDLTPDDRLDSDPVKILQIPDHESVTPQIAIETPRFLESAAKKELSRILKSGALEDVHYPTPWCPRAFFVQKPGSPDDSPKVWLVTKFETCE